jgi:hypothetical protein
MYLHASRCAASDLFSEYREYSTSLVKVRCTRLSRKIPVSSLKQTFEKTSKKTSVSFKKFVVCGTLLASFVTSRMKIRVAQMTMAVLASHFAVVCSLFNV